MVYKSPVMCDILERCGRIARKDKDVPFLILGETGVGKNVLANYIHEQTPGRCCHRFVEACLSRDDNLLDSALFGYRQGAYTGAYRNHDGAFALAEGGSIFLNEIGDISPQGQFKLLKVLDDWQYLPVGGNDYIETDVRVIAATNKPIEYLMEGTHFRSDLYYRLSAELVTIPPLRERLEDIIPLAEYFVDEWNQYHQTTYVLGENDVSLLMEYSFPGNARELKHIVESTARWSGERFNTQYLSGKLIPKKINIAPVSVNTSEPVLLTLEEFHCKTEYGYIKRCLDSTNYNISQTAKILGITRSTLRNKMKYHGLNEVSD